MIEESAPGGPSTGHFAGRRILLLILTIGAAYLLILFLWFFLPAIVTSVTLAILAWPAHQRIAARIGNASVAALLSTVSTFLLVIVPMIGLSILLILQVPPSLDWIGSAADSLVSPTGPLARFLDAAAVWLGIDPAMLSDAIVQQLQNLIGPVAGRTLDLVTGVGGWLLQGGAALFTLYYLLRDGHAFVDLLKWLIPLEPAETEELIRRSREVTYATVYGNVVIALVQGIIGGLIFWLLGIPAPVVWGTVMGLLALLPVIGPPLVWMPASIILMLEGSLIRGILLLLLGTLVISGIDNILRPLIVSGRTQLHPLVVFFSVLGGIYLLGAVGLIVGPVFFAIALMVIEIGRQSLDPAGGSRLGTGGT